MVEVVKYDNPEYKIKFNKPKQWVKVQGKLITQAMTGTSVVLINAITRCCR